jgi:hypothetical protein
MCVQVTKTANRFEISSLLEKILLKQVRWCLTLVGLYIIITLSSEADDIVYETNVVYYTMNSQTPTNSAAENNNTPNDDMYNMWLLTKYLEIRTISPVRY